MSRLLSAIEAALTAKWDRPVTITRHEPVSGGDINDALKLETSEGPFFAKANSGSGPWFSVEAHQLEALRASASILRVPEVVTHADPSPDAPGFLVLEYIERGSRPTDGLQLAEGLAELHQAGAEAYGFDVDTFCGTTVQPNRWTASWVEFYRDHRILHQARLMVDRARIPARETRVFDRLAARLDGLIDDASARPSLIHGDLWSGNHFSDPSGRPVLFDPAAYYAHAEAELGMMTLFGGFSTAVYERYTEASGRDRDWPERNPIYQLYHVMNHATLFGGGYADQAVRLARRFAG